MRVCIPTKTNEGYEARVVPNFAHVPYFVIYDTNLHYLRTIKNKHRHHHDHLAGSPRQTMRQQHIDAVISPEIKGKMLNSLIHSGIKVCRTNDKDVTGVLEHLDQNLSRHMTGARENHEESKVT